MRRRLNWKQTLCTLPATYLVVFLGFDVKHLHSSENWFSSAPQPYPIYLKFVLSVLSCLVLWLSMMSLERERRAADQTTRND